MERVYNALRLAQALLKGDPSTQVTVFLMADAVLAAKAKQKTPEGYYNVERMLKRVLAGKGVVWTHAELALRRLMDDARRSTMEELATATVEADKILVLIQHTLLLS